MGYRELAAIGADCDVTTYHNRPQGKRIRTGGEGKGRGAERILDTD